MAATRRDLYLQVNATTDPFNRAMKAAAGTLAEFGTDVDSQLAAIQQRFNTLAVNDNPARALAASFKRTFAEIQDQAKDALTLPTTKAGAVSLDVGSAQAAATAAERQAVGLREIADAAVRASAATGGTSAELRVFATSATAAALAQEELAKDLRTQANVLEDVQDELNAAGRTAANTGNTVAAAHSRMSTSGLILQHVFRSTSDSFAAGLPITMILGEQIARLGEAARYAAAEAEGSAGLFARFGGVLAGPFGIALTFVITLLGPLVTKLLEADNALQKATLGNDGLTEAQGALGKMFDLTSGKLEHQNTLLRLNAQLTATNLRAEAAKGRADATKTFGNTTGSFTTQLLDSGLSNSRVGPLLQLFGLDATKTKRDANVAAARNIASGVDKGTLDPAAAVRLADKIDFSGLKVTKKEFLDAISSKTAAAFQDKAADEIEQSVRDGKLAPGLRKDEKAKKPKVDHTAEKAANADKAFQTELGGAEDKLAKARLALSDTAEARLAIELAEMDAARVQRDLEIDDQVKAKKISRAQADKLKALVAATTDAEKEAARRKEQAALLDQQYTAEEHARAAQDALLQLDEELADTRKERLAIERRLLADQQGARRAALQKTLADPTKSQAEKNQATADLARLPAQDARERDALEKRDEGPLAKYRDELRGSVGDTNDALDGIKVDALKGLEDGFEGLISGSETVAGAIKKMVTSILADLARMAAQKLLLNALGSLIGGSGGFSADTSGVTSSLTASNAAFKFADGGHVRGPGSGTSDSILARLSNGEFVMNAEATKRFLPMLHAMNDNRLPGFATGGLVGGAPIRLPTFADNDVARPASAGHTISVAVDARGATDPALIEAAATRAVIAAAPLLTEAARGDTVNYLRREQLPGGLG